MQGSLYKIRLILCTSLDSTRLTDERRKEIKDKEFGTSQNDRREGNQKVEKGRRGVSVLRLRRELREKNGDGELCGYSSKV